MQGHVLEKHMMPSIANNQTGSTLIEVLIALLVFTIGLQGIASMQFQSVKDNFDSAQRSHGIWAAQELINRIRANPSGREAGDYSFPKDNPCDGNIPDNYCADTDTNNAPVCAADEMAAFDIWESICTTPNQAHDQNNGQLFNPNLEIICAACDADSEYTLTLEWQSKSVSDDDVIVADDALKTQRFQQVFRP